MRLLDRYLIREIVPYVVLTLVLLTSVIFLHEANRFSELFIVFSRNGLPTGPLFLVVAAVLPQVLLYTIPISLLIGVLVGLGRLSGDSEITAMRASGVSRRHLMIPLLAVGIVAAGVMTFLTFEAAPAAEKRIDALKNTKGDLIYQGLATQIKPRIFEESIPGKVFYIQDIDRRTNEWRNIFIADSSTDDNPDDVRIYTARTGRLTSPVNNEELPEFHLFNAQAHTASNVKERRKLDYSVQNAEKLTIQFQSQPEAESAGPVAEPLPALNEMDISTLTAYAAPPEQAAEYETEINKRFALPVTCIIFAVIGLAFGVYNQRAGRSFGLVLGLLLTTIFYVLLLGGENGARNGALPPWLGVWGPNMLFAGFGLWTTFRHGLPNWAQLGALAAGTVQRLRDAIEARVSKGHEGRTLSWLAFPRILDRMILADLGRHIVFVVIGMTVVFMVFTVFDILGEIVRNGVPYGVVLGYVLYLSPQIIAYMMPLAMLVGVMVTFGLMESGSQIVAFKASGQSIYRLVIPVLVLACGLSIGLFAIQNYILPTTNRQQEDLRQQIRSGQEPPRTVYQVDRQWIFGQQDRIFYYRHYDPTSDSFADLSIFDLDPTTFQITRRVFASTATWEPGTQTWLLEYGWMRTFEGSDVIQADAFRQQRIQLAERPEYFKRSVGEASKLNYEELKHQISELSQSGFDVLDLKIDLQGKLAFPVTCLIMAIVGLPFAFSVGRRGALYGVSVGLAIGLLFWGALGLFTQMGRYEILPPILAAWGPNMLFGAGGLYLFLTTKT